MTDDADLVARARARLSALTGRLRAAGPVSRLARLVAGVTEQVHPAEAAAFEEAAREAFRAATTLQATRPLTPVPTAELPAASSDTAHPVTAVSAPAIPAVIPAAAPIDAPTPMPAAALTPKPGAKPILKPGPKPAAKPVPEPSARPMPASAPAAGAKPAAKPVAKPVPEPMTPERPAARQSRRQAGRTAPDHLLRRPKGVDSQADEFFDGLTRQVEGDR